MPVYFLIGDRKGVDLDETGGRKELGKAEGGEGNLSGYVV